MIKITRLFYAFIFSSVLLSCTTSAYITDNESIKRQKEMRKYRTGVNFAEVGLWVASAVGEALTGVNVYPTPSTQGFRKLMLINESKDSLFVNMITDWLWKDSSYCDIREIEIPPLKSAKVIVPVGAAYNVFFRTNYDDPDDEKVEVNTIEIRRVKLKSGLGISTKKTGN